MVARDAALRKPCETAGEALRRLERRPDYLRLVGSDDGQELLRAAAREAAEARRRAVPA